MKKLTSKFVRDYSVVDNLFVVESPLQALVAVELSLSFKSKKNIIIYRLSNKNRKRNNEQIEKVIDKGSWFKVKRLSLEKQSPLATHMNLRKELKNIEAEFKGRVGQLFIGEFRSQWMHYIRTATLPGKTILMDDGAATVTVKRNFLDKKNYFPTIVLNRKNFFKETFKNILYWRFLKRDALQSKIYLASAFFVSDSLYPIDFSNLKELLGKVANSTSKRVLFFGSKYSEAKIISLKYELEFIRRVKNYYSNYGCDFIYCAHRDESKEKLEIIEREIDLRVLISDLPAEVLIIQNSNSIVEISSAYSSVLNNAKMIIPEVDVRAFHLNPEEISLRHRNDILLVYKHFEREGISVELSE